MAFDTYPGLLAAIPAWAMRTGDTQFEAQVPDFIRLCETRFNRTLRIGRMEAVAVGVTDDDGYADLPSDYLEYRGVSSGVRGYPGLDYVTPDTFVGSLEGAGVPRQFTIVGNQIRTGPTSTGDITLSYYAKVPPLSDAAPTNWLLTAAPDLYLYGSLLEAAPYMEEDARAQVWKTYYDTAMADLRASDVSARYANGRARVRGATP